MYTDDSTGKPYWYNEGTGQTTWKDPNNAQKPAAKGGGLREERERFRSELDDIDQLGCKYLASLRDRILQEQNHFVLPLNTTGDGSCLLHACSRAIWGVELFSGLLRQKVAEELEENKSWYVERVGEGDWQTGVTQAKQRSAYLTTLHIVALSHVIQRPILLYASQQDIDNFGVGFFGVAGVFVPLRLEASVIDSHPVAVSWQSNKHDHFIPLVWARSSQGLSATVRWHVPQQSTPCEIPDPFGIENSPNPARWLDCTAEVREPGFVTELIKQIKEAHLQVEAHLATHGGMPDEELGNMISKEFLLGATPASASESTAKGQQLWGRAKQALKKVQVGGGEYDFGVEHRGKTIGIDADENVYDAMCRINDRKDISSIDEDAEAVQRLRRRARFTALVATHEGVARRESANPGGDLSPQGFSQLATAVVRARTELQHLLNKPVVGVEVHPKQALPLVWDLKVDDTHLCHSHEVELHFPSSYPYDPPVAKLKLGAAGMSRDMVLPVCASWDFMDSARDVVISVKDQIAAGLAHPALQQAYEIEQVAVEYFALLDTNKDGKVDHAEGADAMLKAYGISAERAHSLWSKLLVKADPDQNKILTLGEWRAFTKNAANMGKLPSLKKQMENIKASQVSGRAGKQA